MKIQLGIRGSSDSVNHILIKIDDLILMNKDKLSSLKPLKWKNLY